MKTRTMSLKALIKYAITGRSNKKALHIFFKPNKKLVTELKKKGINIENYHHAIDSYAIKHILINHGDAENEFKRGQIPITLDQFDLIPKIIKQPSSFRVKKEKNQLFIEYIKQYKNKIYYVEEILTGQKLLVTKTMYIKKTRQK